MAKSNKNTSQKVKNVPARSKKPSLELSMAPSSVGAIAYSKAPRVSGTEKIVVRRREFVGSATNGATTGFALTNLSTAVPGYDFNPSSGLLFPWLAQMSGCFERFRFNRLKFDFIPGQATSTAGRFYAAIDYDYDDAPASSKQVLMGNMSAVESAVWQASSLTASPTSLNRDMPYRHISCTTRGLTPEGRTSYAGYLMVGFDTSVANCLMDIWVEYEVELVTPVSEGIIVQSLDYPLAAVTATGALTSAVGTAFAGSVAPSKLVLEPGPITIAIGGGYGVPLFRVPVGGTTYLAGYALDCREAKNKSMLSLNSRFNTTADAPNALLGAGGLDVIWSAFDYLGTYLGEVSPTTVSSVVKAIGPLTGTGGSVAAWVYQITTVPLEKLQPVYPTMRYLAPLLVGLAAYGVGNTAFGFATAF